LILACLQRDKQDSEHLDLYFNISQHVILSVQGAPEIHLSGYFEPNRDQIEENMLLGDDEEEESEEELNEEEFGKAKLNKNLKTA